MNTCIFCSIIKGDIPSLKVYEDEEVYAFLDNNPNSIGHALVIPKKHYENIFDTEEEVFAHTMRKAQKLAKAIQRSLNADGINIAINNGAAAGQVVFHLHIHIIPRFNNDHERLGRHITYKEGEADKILEKIKAHID